MSSQNYLQPGVKELQGDWGNPSFGKPAARGLPTSTSFKAVFLEKTHLFGKKHTVYIHTYIHTYLYTYRDIHYLLRNHYFSASSIWKTSLSNVQVQRWVSRFRWGFGAEKTPELDSEDYEPLRVSHCILRTGAALHWCEGLLKHPFSA